jgi:HEAT repeat protein
MNRNPTRLTFMITLFFVSGCNQEERGPILAGGRDVKSWVADLKDPKPTVRRQAVLKLGNVGDADPSVAENLAEALRDSDTVVRRDAVRAVAKLRKPNEAIMAQLKVMSESDRDSLARDYAKRTIDRFFPESGR